MILQARCLRAVRRRTDQSYAGASESGTVMWAHSPAASQAQRPSSGLAVSSHTREEDLAVIAVTRFGKRNDLTSDGGS
jgi:hypothetical protein